MIPSREKHGDSGSLVCLGREANDGDKADHVRLLLLQHISTNYMHDFCPIFFFLWDLNLLEPPLPLIGELQQVRAPHGVCSFSLMQCIDIFRRLSVCPMSTPYLLHEDSSDIECPVSRDGVVMYVRVSRSLDIEILPKEP